MTTITHTSSNLLRNALRGNGIFSAVTGAILTIGAGQFVSMMGAGTAVFYGTLGMLLLFHAGTLFFFTRSPQISKPFAWYAIIGDVVWVLVTAVILLTDAFGISVMGKWILLIIGDAVLLFAIVQTIGVRRIR